MKTTMGDCDFCDRSNVLVTVSRSYGDDPIGFCLECAKEFVAAQPSVQSDTPCVKCGGRKAHKINCEDEIAFA